MSQTGAIGMGQHCKILILFTIYISQDDVILHILSCQSNQQHHAGQSSNLGPMWHATDLDISKIIIYKLILLRMKRKDIWQQEGQFSAIITLMSQEFGNDDDIIKSCQVNHPMKFNMTRLGHFSHSFFYHKIHSLLNIIILISCYFSHMKISSITEFSMRPSPTYQQFPSYTLSRDCRMKVEVICILSLLRRTNWYG